MVSAKKKKKVKNFQSSHKNFIFLVKIHTFILILKIVCLVSSEVVSHGAVLILALQWGYGPCWGRFVIFMDQYGAGGEKGRPFSWASLAVRIM